MQEAYRIFFFKNMKTLSLNDSVPDVSNCSTNNINPNVWDTIKVQCVYVSPIMEMALPQQQHTK